ncbi:helix-turn-helix transcriptional regulator [Halopenitus sp. H-Gu1]|uniref:helix-turn-helix transcriptional regulator n=1 Tax=Halopenitus sp. H-Gu1 TaxID=3242697 RepID=UPI00359EEB9B
MSTPKEVHGDVRYLAGSPGRIAILRVLREEPLRPAEITRRVDSTRTTVQRVLAGFRERCWVCEHNATYQLTPTGEQVYAAYEELLAAAERAREFAPLASHLTSLPEGPPPEAFAAGELTVATSSDPLAPVEDLLDRFEDARGTHVRSISPIVTRTFNEAALDLLETGATIELVIDERVLTASAENFPVAFDRAREREDITVQIHPDPLSAGLLAFEGTTCVVAYDDQNALRAILACEDEPTVAEWATDWFERLWQRSQPLAEAVDT